MAAHQYLERLAGREFEMRRRVAAVVLTVLAAVLVFLALVIGGLAAFREWRIRSLEATSCAGSPARRSPR